MCFKSPVAPKMYQPCLERSLWLCRAPAAVRPRATSAGRCQPGGEGGGHARDVGRVSRDDGRAPNAPDILSQDDRVHLRTGSRVHLDLPRHSAGNCCCINIALLVQVSTCFREVG